MTADDALVRQMLGISAVKAYIAAIVDLWSFQKRKGLNLHPNPREGDPQRRAASPGAWQTPPAAARIRGQDCGDLTGRIRRGEDDQRRPILLARLETVDRAVSTYRRRFPSRP
jgi:hypothetical protein